eukprot:3398643-Rhodomonas_salina.1
MEREPAAARVSFSPKRVNILSIVSNDGVVLYKRVAAAPCSLPVPESHKRVSLPVPETHKKVCLSPVAPGGAVLYKRDAHIPSSLPVPEPHKIMYPLPVNESLPNETSDAITASADKEGHD